MTLTAATLASVPGVSPSPAEGAHCPAARLLEVLGRKHMLPLLQLFVKANPRHFNELRQLLPLSPKTLSDRLKELVGLGILDRKPLGGIPPRVEYSLNPRAEGLCEVFACLDRWAARFLDRPAPEEVERGVKGLAEGQG